MCGIIGAFERDPDNNLIDRFTNGIESLRHRGPDDSGQKLFKGTYGSFHIGHTRLSIIDLSEGGHQPRMSKDGRYCLVFNGEIYNYRELRVELIKAGCVFETNSDTEVLLNSWIVWGVEALRKLTGMFAFAVLDIQMSTVTLVRDAFGIKPLYYCIINSSIYFSSEIPSLLNILESPPRINKASTLKYLSTGQYDNSEETFFECIYHLRPGHYLTIDFAKHSNNNYEYEALQWWWPSIKVRSDISFKEACLKFREMFLDNIRLHLRSDVSVGAALSGGLDSSAVVCAMRYLEPNMPINTFSYIARGSQANEEYWVDLVNNHINAIPNKIYINPDELTGDLEDMIFAQGEPFGSTSIYAQYRVFKAASNAGIIVTLDGQGADELLAGYKGYPYAYLQSMLDDGRYFEIPRFLYSWSRWPGRSYYEAILMLVASLTPKTLKTLAKQIRMSNRQPSWYINSDKSILGSNSKTAMNSDLLNEGKGRRLVEALRFALTGSGLSSLLRHGDRNSMRWSIESRVPFLTVEMAEFILTLPESYLLSSKGQTKHIFREALRGIVPDEILDRRDKIGFETPEKRWLESKSREITLWLSEQNEVPFIDKTEVLKDVTQTLNGHKKYDQRIWRLINYSIWLNNRNISKLTKL